jgi:hypothetical protein
MEKLDLRRFPTLCLVCGVDSGPIKTFLFIFMGGLVASSLMIWLWAWGTKRISTSEKLSHLPLEAEERKEFHVTE